jgi:hypothetical protein
MRVTIQWARNLILILGLLIVIFLCLRAVLTRAHKAIGHPVGDDVVLVYIADPSSKAPIVLVHDFVKDQTIATDQRVNVYIKYSFEDHDVLELAGLILIVAATGLVLYSLTYLVVRFLPGRDSHD